MHHKPRKLTQLGVDRIKPPKTDARDVYPDVVLPSFQLRVSKTGLKAYSLVTRFQGEQFRLKCGRNGIVTLAEARDTGRQALKGIEEGVDPRAIRRKAKAAPSDAVEDVVEEFMRLYKGRSPDRPIRPRTKEENSRILRARVVPQWKGRSMGSIRRREIIDFLDELAVDTPALANKSQGVITMLFDWALDREIIDASPAARLRAPAAKVKRKRALGDDDIKTVWKVWDDLGYPWGDVQKLLLLTGQRREEISAMSWPEIDLENKQWTIPAERTKSDRENIVPLSKQAVAILKSLPRFTGDFVFTTGDGEKHVVGYSKAKRRTDDAIAKLVKSGAEKVEPWRWHDLRRTVKTGMSKLKVSELVSELVLNHAMPGLESIYNVHQYEEEKLAALQTWANYVERLTGDVPDNVVPLSEAQNAG